jgi:tight adherence protein C
MLTATVIAASAIIVLHFLARSKYHSILSKTDGKSYPLKKLLPGAMLSIDFYNRRFGKKYSAKKAAILTRLCGRENLDAQMTVYRANRLLYVELCTLFAGFAGFIAKASSTDIVIFWVVLAAIITFMSEKELGRRMERKTRSIQIEIPDFVNKLALLINAGMNFRRAWQKAADENPKSTPIYLEARQVSEEISSGRPELTSYENFAKRCGIPEITRLVTVIVQNIKRGNSDMVSVLRISANECWQTRKNAARRLGEEASTKMLLPLMLMFAAILIITAAPAVIALGLI